MTISLVEGIEFVTCIVEVVAIVIIRLVQIRRCRVAVCTC